MEVELHKRIINDLGSEKSLGGHHHRSVVEVESFFGSKPKNQYKKSPSFLFQFAMNDVMRASPTFTFLCVIVKTSRFELFPKDKNFNLEGCKTYKPETRFKLRPRAKNF